MGINGGARFSWPVNVLGITEAEAMRLLAVGRTEPDNHLVSRATVMKVQQVGFWPFKSVHVAMIEREGYAGSRLSEVYALVRPEGMVR